MLIDISKKNKAALLVALYDNSLPVGIVFNYHDYPKMTIKDAEELLSKTKCFDYINGHVLFIDFNRDTYDTRRYNTTNGYYAAERVIDSVPNVN